MKIHVVSDDLRGNARGVGGKWAEHYEALAAGKTVFIPEAGDSTRATFSNAASRRGFRSYSSARTVEGQTGILLWWEKVR